MYVSGVQGFPARAPTEAGTARNDTTAGASGGVSRQHAYHLDDLDDEEDEGVEVNKPGETGTLLE